MPRPNAKPASASISINRFVRASDATCRLSASCICCSNSTVRSFIASVNAVDSTSAFMVLEQLHRPPGIARTVPGDHLFVALGVVRSRQLHPCVQVAILLGGD